MNYTFGFRTSAGGISSDPDAHSVRVTITALPSLETVKVYAVVTALNGTVTIHEITATGTLNFANAKGATVEIRPLYNDHYSAGSVTGSVRTFRADGSTLGTASISDGVSVVSNPNYSSDDVGGAGGDILFGNADTNRLVGLGGDDILNGSPGADHLIGGEGIDAADYGLSSAGINVTLGGLATGGDAQSDDLVGIENLLGSAHADTLTGDGGSNLLEGRGGDDVLAGGLGDDQFVVGVGTDTVVEHAGEGFDRVLAAASFTLQAGSEVEMFTTTDNLATTAINLTGNALSQYIYGNAGANEIDGGGGGDVMYGFEGDDRFYIRNVADRVVEFAGGGFDRVLAGASFTLEAGSEVEMFTTTDNLATTAINLTGNALSQYLYGNAGANVLDGGGGGDVMYGFEGDDFFVIRDASDRVVESAGGGANDRVFAAASFTLEAGSEVELLTTIDNLATTAINLTGNELAQYMYGNAGANILDGKGGRTC